MSTMEEDCLEVMRASSAARRRASARTIILRTFIENHPYRRTRRAGTVTILFSDIDGSTECTFDWRAAL